MSYSSALCKLTWPSKMTNGSVFKAVNPTKVDGGQKTNLGNNTHTKMFYQDPLVILLLKMPYKD